MAFMPLFADGRLGLKSSLIGIVLAVRSPVSILQSYTGRLADRWNRRLMVICGGLASMIAISFIPKTGGFWLLFAAYIFLILGQAFGVPAANAFVVHEGRTYGMGASMTMFMFAMHAGNGVGPVALGGIADWLGLESAFYAAAVCMAAGVVLFASMIRDSARESVS
jgi:predicted MFS family arabinose efflux permease